MDYGKVKIIQAVHSCEHLHVKWLFLGLGGYWRQGKFEETGQESSGSILSK